MKLIFRKQHPVQTCIAPFDRFRKDGQTLRPEQANEISDGSETKEDINDILNRKLMKVLAENTCFSFLYVGRNLLEIVAGIPRRHTCKLTSGSDPLSSPEPSVFCHVVVTTF